MSNSPPTHGDVYPSLTYANAAAAIDWLCDTFGFVKRLVVPGPEDSIMHSELSFAAAVIMVSSPKPEMGRVALENQKQMSHTLCMSIDDPDAHYQRSKAAGAEILQEIKDEEYGSRGYMVRDIEGHIWYFGTYRPGAYWED